MEIRKNVSLKNYNTFGIAANARFFCEIGTVEELRQALGLREHPEKIILGGGSNMLIVKDIEALVIHIGMKGIQVVEENGETAVIKAMAGENWHTLVLWTLEQGYGGLENLSLIPGNTGTAPVQNIGAYGVELKDVLESCQAMDTETLEIRTFNKEECRFGYRDSFFKNEGKGKYIIVSVTLKLSKKNHRIQTSYGSIENELKNNGIQNPTIKDISEAVISIRKSKLPDPKVLGNSGSFFKNPVLGKKKFDVFIKDHPDAPFYKVTEKEFKIPAGWLIEQCGFKGKRSGDAGVHKNQALVLVNYGNATGSEIMDLATSIQKSVLKKFQIHISPEVNIIDL